MGSPVQSAITTKGQATIPKAIRDDLGLKPGDRVKFFVHPDGTVVLPPNLPVSALRGMLKPRGTPVPQFPLANYMAPNLVSHGFLNRPIMETASRR